MGRVARAAAPGRRLSLRHALRHLVQNESNLAKHPVASHCTEPSAGTYRVTGPAGTRVSCSYSSVLRPKSARRRMVLTVAGPCLASWLAAGVTRAQEPEGQRDAAVFRADTALVVLDLVVRDRKGQPVRDLRQDEV